MNIDIIYFDKENKKFCFSHASQLVSKGEHIESRITINEEQKCTICNEDTTKEILEHFPNKLGIKNK